MKFLLVLAAIVAIAAADLAAYGSPPPTYGVAPGSNPGYPTGGTDYGTPAHVPQVFRHVYVHSAPDEAGENQSRVIRVPGGDKHVNIIFVKTPSSSNSHQTEVILPEQDAHKNLVYVLLKKGGSSSDVKITRPGSPAPQKPQVYFIRYGNEGGQGYSGGPATTGPSVYPRTSPIQPQYGSY